MYKPEIGQGYWFVDSDNGVSFDTWQNDYMDNLRVGLYRTHIEAQIISENKVTHEQIKELNRNYSLDWITYLMLLNTYEPIIYKEALKKIGKEKLEQYLKGGL
jgi:hypothetical protein